MKPKSAAIMKKCGAVFLICCLLLFIGGGTVAEAAEVSAKEEVVYASLDAAGNTEGIYVVNIWSGGTVTDYGDYTTVKMLTTNEDITQDGDEITFTTEEDRVYYQGDLDPDTGYGNGG